MATAIEKKAFEMADAVAEKLECCVVDIEYTTENKQKVLRIFIDKNTGVGIDECEAFSRAFETEFDKLNIINEAYTLEVSSPGVDRILKTQREFLHYIGKRVSIKLYKAINGKKEFDGLLTGYEDKIAKVVADDSEINIPISEAVYIRLYFEM